MVLVAGEGSYEWFVQVRGAGGRARERAATRPRSSHRLEPPPFPLPPPPFPAPKHPQRDFEPAGLAAQSLLLPLARRKRLTLEGTNSCSIAQLYAKPILELDPDVAAPAGKRIGF